MIERISRIQGHGVFRNFAWPQDLPKFGKYNLIYGWNGSGKTTLSRIFRDLQLKQVPNNGDVQLSITGSTVLRGVEFPNASVPVRVFNRDFVEQNVFRADKGDVPPIFVLGQESVEKQKQIEELKEKRIRTQAVLDKAKSDLAKSDQNFNAYRTEQAGRIKEMLRSHGDNLYNNYDRRNYNSRAEQMESINDFATHQLTEERRTQLLTQIRDNPKSKIKEILYQLPNISARFNEVSELLLTTVTSDIIQKLHDNAELSQWVHTGLVLHQNQSVAECLFCEQIIPAERIQALENHFNDAYEQFLQQINSKIKEIDAEISATELKLPDQSAFYESIVPDFTALKSSVEKDLEDIKAFLGSLVQALNDKITRPFITIPLAVSIPQIDDQVINRLNKIIHNHNEFCDDFQNKLETARKQLESDYVASGISSFQSLKSEIQTHKSLICATEKELEIIIDEIASLESEIRQHRLPAEELNEDIRHYLGHQELQLQVKENGYTIVRNGSPATALSEGESTAVALLYFLKSLNDTGFDSATGTVVLDDPVSSLDSNALFYALGFIQERTDQAGQLFVFTHNFTFFKEVLNWFKHVPQNKNLSRFYMLDCVNINGLRQSTLKKLDSLIEKHESDYHYLFACVYRCAQSNSTSVETNYNLPNMARRLLETFLGFRKPGINKLGEALRQVNLDTAKRRRIDRFVNAFSHRQIVGEPDQNPFTLSEAPSICQDILGLIKDEDTAHFDEMVKLVKRSN